MSNSSSMGSEPPQPHAGTAGNEALTSWTGLLLIPLLGLVGLTGAAFGSLWRTHLIVGILLVPVIGLKLVTTSYRAVRYYARSKHYRAAGPPVLPLRLLAPPLVIVTIVAMWSGIVMWHDNARTRPWSTIHTGSVVIMGGLVGIHGLAYLARALAAVRHDMTRRRAVTSATAVRLALVVAVLAIGIVVGILTQPPVPFPVGHRGGGDGFRIPAARNGTS